MSKSYDIDHEAEHAKRVLPDLLATLKAIQQRINGEWDAPELTAKGPLRPNTTDDILTWAGDAIAKATQS